MVNIAILASGSGSNAENIVRFFESNTAVRVVSIISNKEDAYVHQRAKMLNIESVTFSKKDFEAGDIVLAYMKDKKVDFVVLAGFLLKIPLPILNQFPQKIVNIHPALLPLFGGKGMYGDRVHQAVVESGVEETGITIHYINEHYDEGDIIFQVKCAVNKEDSYTDVAKKVHTLEYKYFPSIISKVLFG